MAKLDWYIRANLKPRHLQLLVALDDLRNIGRAAELLNVTQPAVSKTLAEIERGLGVALFERGPRGLSPTAYGDTMVRLCRTMLRSLDEAGEHLRYLKSGIAGSVRVGVLPAAAPVLAPHAAIRMHEVAPRSLVVFHEGTADRLLPMLREGHLDIVVGTLPPLSMTGGLEVKILHEGELSMALCGHRHPLASSAKVSPEDLKKYPLIVPPRGTIYRSVVEQLMDALDLSMAQVKVESGSITSTNTYLRETDAIGFYAGQLAQHYSRLGLLKILPVELPGIRVPVGCVWPRNLDRDGSVRLMIRMLEEVSAREYDAAVE